MQCFTFVHGKIEAGLLVSTNGGQHIFLGENVEGGKAYKLEISQENPPDIIDKLMYEGFYTIAPNERPMLMKPERKSQTVLLRINTTSPISETKARGKWYQVFGRLNIIAHGKGKRGSWIDSVITLHNGSAVVITELGGLKFLVLNCKGRLLCSKVEQQLFLDRQKRFTEENVAKTTENPTKKSDIPEIIVAK